jgi:hypothetical protein
LRRLEDAFAHGSRCTLYACVLRCLERPDHGVAWSSGWGDRILDTGFDVKVVQPLGDAKAADVIGIAVDFDLVCAEGVEAYCRYSFTSKGAPLNLKALSVPLTYRKIPLAVGKFLYS